MLRIKAEKNQKLTGSIIPLDIYPIMIDANWRASNLKNVYEYSNFVSSKSGDFSLTRVKFYESLLWSKSVECRIWNPGLKSDCFKDGEIFDAIQNLIKTVIRKRDFTTFDDTLVSIEVDFDIESGYHILVNELSEGDSDLAFETHAQIGKEAVKKLIIDAKYPSKSSMRTKFSRRVLEIIDYPYKVLLKAFMERAHRDEFPLKASTLE
jgi:hypothetical protein